MTLIFICRGLWSKTEMGNVEDHSQISRLETRALSDLPTTQVPIQPIKSVPGGLRQEMSVIDISLIVSRPPIGQKQGEVRLGRAKLEHYADKIRAILPRAFLKNSHRV